MARTLILLIVLGLSACATSTIPEDFDASFEF